MKLRRYIESDCQELAVLFYETVHAVNIRDYTKEQVDAWATGHVDLEAWNRSFLEHDTVVAVERETVIGFGDMDAGGYLDRLYVHKDWQGKGIAAEICRKLEKNCPAGRFTTHASITARPFFESRGYRVVKEQQVEREGVSLTNYVMEKVNILGIRDGYTLRAAKKDDVAAYLDGFFPVEEETARLTGCRRDFTREEVEHFFLRCIRDRSRQDFLIEAPDGRIAGESVIHEVNRETGNAGFRIALFGACDRGKGLGRWAVEKTRDFAFENMGLQRLELEVFSFNPRARKIYGEAGFRQEEVLPGAAKDGDSPGDIICMAITEKEWREIRRKGVPK